MMNSVVPAKQALMSRASTGTKVLTTLATKKGNSANQQQQTTIKTEFRVCSYSPSFPLTFLQIADGLIIVLQFQVTLTQEKVGLN